MKICVIGAGAIGGFIGAKLAAAAQAGLYSGAVDVAAVARGETLSALQQHGWRLHTAAGVVQAPVQVAASPAELAAVWGTADVVVVAVKGPALAAVAAEIAPLLAPDTVVMPAMNGVPWWFCQGQGLPEFDNQPLASIDPAGQIGRAIALKRVLGCVVHASTFCPEPGVVQHKMGQGLLVGEPGSIELQPLRSSRAQALVDVLKTAGFDATLSPRIRFDIWYKLWGNMTMNPVSALTGATTDRILADPLVRRFCGAAMQEAAAVGARIGCPIDQAPEDRHAITAKLGAFKTSMLQDLEANRVLELDALVGVVHEIAQRLGVATPNIDALLGLTRLFAQQRGLYPVA